MTVQELIEELMKVENKSLPVITEGCDCDGDAGSVIEESRCIKIRRELIKD